MMRALALVAVAATTAGAQPITHPADSLPDRLHPTVTDSSPPPDDPGHLWTIGLLATPDQNRYGIRLQVDLFSLGSWAAGIAGTAGTAMQADPTLMTSDKTFAGEAFVAHAIDLLGPLRLRVQGGAGIGTRSSFVDASVAATLSLGDRFGVVAGPILQSGDTDSLLVFVGIQLR